MTSSEYRLNEGGEVCIVRYNWVAIPHGMDWKKWWGMFHKGSISDLPCTSAPECHFGNSIQRRQGCLTFSLFSLLSSLTHSFPHSQHLHSTLMPAALSPSPLVAQHSGSSSSGRGKCKCSIRPVCVWHASTHPF